MVTHYFANITRLHSGAYPVYTAYTHEHTIPAQRSVHPQYTQTSQRGLLSTVSYILYALTVL